MTDESYRDANARAYLAEKQADRDARTLFVMVLCIFALLAGLGIAGVAHAIMLAGMV